MPKIGTLWVDVIANTKLFNLGIAKALLSTKSLGVSAGKLGAALKGIPFAIAGGAALAAVGAFAALNSITKKTIAGAAGFQTQLSLVNTMLSSKTEPLLSSFRESLLTMSVQFGESTETLSKGLFDILSASIPAGQAIDFLKASTIAAKAGFTTTAVSADILTTVVKSYGFEAGEVTRVSDVLFATVQRGKLNFEQLASKFGQVASIAASSGVGFEEASAAISTMTRTGLSASDAITSLRGIIVGFITAPQSATKAAKQFGIDLSQAGLRAEGLEGIIKKLGNLPPDAIGKIFPNIEALRGLAPLLNDLSGFLSDVGKIKSSGGATQSAFEKTSTTASEALKRHDAAIAAEKSKRTTLFAEEFQRIPQAFELAFAKIGTFFNRIPLLGIGGQLNEAETIAANLAKFREAQEQKMVDAAGKAARETQKRIQAATEQARIEEDITTARNNAETANKNRIGRFEDQVVITRLRGEGKVGDARREQISQDAARELRALEKRRKRLLDDGKLKEKEINDLTNKESQKIDELKRAKLKAVDDEENRKTQKEKAREAEMKAKNRQRVAQRVIDEFKARGLSAAKAIASLNRSVFQEATSRTAEKIGFLQIPRFILPNIGSPTEQEIVQRTNELLIEARERKRLLKVIADKVGNLAVA